MFVCPPDGAPHRWGAYEGNDTRSGNGVDDHGLATHVPASKVRFHPQTNVDQLDFDSARRGARRRIGRPGRCQRNHLTGA